LPIATIYLLPEELAYFLFVGTLLGMAYLAEGGVNRVILRATAYFKVGTTKLPNNFEELQELKSDGNINYKLLGELVQTSFVIYFILGVVSLILFFTIGYISSENIISKQPDLDSAYITFALLSVFAFLYIMQLRWVGLIQGLGHLAKQKRVELVFGLVRIVLSVLAIVLGFGVLGVVTSMLFSVVVAHILYKKMFYSYLPKHSIDKYQHFRKDILVKLTPSAWKQSVLAWGSYLIYQGTSLLAAQLEDVKLVASYLLTLQVIRLLMRISNAPAYSYYPNIAKVIAKHDMFSFKRLLFKSLKISLVLYFIGSIVIYFLGNKLLYLLGANAFLVPSNLLLMLLFIYFLELHHVTHATIYTATNHIPFVLPALISGAVLIAGGWFLIGDYGLWGIVLFQFVVQICCNNWYPVWLNYKIIKFSESVIKPVPL
jgi:O-antigen/teichoic acid export membrane protein